jgi:Uma2 family endonuclease
MPQYGRTGWGRVHGWLGAAVWVAERADVKPGILCSDMPQAALAHAPEPAIEPALGQHREPSHVWRLEGATWADFQRLLELRRERPVPRFAYLEGTLEIMSPSRSHEHIKSMIGCLVEAWCMERGIDIMPYGSWLLESKTHGRGIEPDECYVVGEVTDPPVPDLAIEVVWSSGGVSKLEIYRKLGVREVWFWKEERLHLYALRGSAYEPIERSEILPGLDHELLLRHVDVLSVTKAVTAFRAALRG